MDWERSGGGVGMPGVGDTQSSINGIFSTSTYCTTSSDILESEPTENQEPISTAEATKDLGGKATGWYKEGGAGGAEFSTAPDANGEKEKPVSR